VYGGVTCGVNDSSQFSSTTGATGRICVSGRP